jgi:hypothetical protein
VYVDFDDTLIIHNKLCLPLVHFLYQCVNEGIPCYLISRHDGDLHEKLKRWRIESLFDEVIHLRQEEENPALLSMQTPYLLMIASVNVMKYIARWALIHLMSACWICFLRSDHEENVVFIHLESLNQAIYSHRQWFPCLNSIAPHSLRFNNLFSATSSFMAVSDLLHGDDDVLEHNVNFEVGLSIKRKAPSMFDQLRKAGYRTAGLGFRRIGQALI